MSHLTFKICFEYLTFERILSAPWLLPSYLCCVNQKLLTTIETNEPTKGGKITLDLAHIFSEEDKEVTIIERKTKGVPNKETERILQENDRSREWVMGFDRADEFFKKLLTNLGNT